MPIKYVFVLIPITMASIGFRGPAGSATGGGGKLIYRVVSNYFHLSIVTSMSIT
jgi:uncharacterized membrane protein YtjA (UPF0391 family)